MSAPSSDGAAIRQVVTALVEAGHRLAYVLDGGEDPVKLADLAIADAVEAVTAVDIARLYVDLVDGTGTGWVLFVLGNGDPLDLVADWTTSLSPTIDPVMANW